MSKLVDEIEAALSVPNSERSPAQLRLLIAQGMATVRSVESALDTLKVNPLIDTQYYPGDLLKAVLDIDGSYWAEHPSHWSDAHGVLTSIDQALKNIQEARHGFVSMK